MSKTLTALSELCEAPTGGNRKVEYLAVDNLTGFERITLANNLQKAIQPISGGWLTAPLESESKPHREEFVQDDQGGYHNQSVSGTIQGRSSELVFELNKMKNRGFVLRVTDNDDNVHLIGTPTEPLYFTYVFDSGASARNNKVFSVRWAGRTRKAALHYNPVF